MGLNGVERINALTQGSRPRLAVEDGKVMSVPLGGKTVTVETNNDVSEMKDINYNPYKEKDYEKQRTKELTELFKMNGRNEKEAQKLAKAYVKNEKEKYEFYMTKTFDDKEEFKLAKKETKELRKENETILRERGMSKQKAKEVAKASEIQNRLLKNKKALEILENNKEVFFDEDGNLSQEKIKKFVKSLMNPATNDFEVDNYHMSLKEARLMAEVIGCDDKTLRKIAKATGANYEKDYSTLINIATAALFAGVAGAAGLPFKVASESISTSFSGVPGAVSGSIAGAKASVNAAAVTAPLGGALGAIIGGKDKGSVEDRVYAPETLKPKLPEPELKVEWKFEKPDISPITLPELKQREPIEPEPCVVVVQNGESLIKLSKKYGVSVDEIKRLNADKLKRFHNSYNCNDKKVYEGFLVGTEILIPNGCDKAAGNKDKYQAQKDYENSVIRDQGKFCNERLRSELTSKEFRKQHKIGEFVEEK